MPTVRRATSNLVDLRPVTGAKFVAPNFGGSGVGAGLKSLSRGIDEVEQFAAQQQDMLDEANAKKLYNDYVQHSNDILHSGQNPYFAMEGESALLNRTGVEQSLTSKREDLLKTANSKQQRRMLADVLGRRVEDDLNGIGVYAVTQGKKYSVDEATATRALNADDAVHNAFNPDVSEKAIAAGRAENDRLARLQQMGPERAKASDLAYVSGIRKDVALRYIYEGPGGADAAEAYLKRYDADFTGDDRAGVETHIRTQRNAIAAEGRRQEAEARRIAREDKQDAGDRAEGALRILNTGTPLPPDKVATAIEDAKRSEREDLVFSVAQASFKNDLNVQWRNATPADLQTHINALGAKIAKAGNSPDAKDVTEFEHLSGVLRSSREQLSKDPLAWGAQHLGYDVGPINWSDQNSVGQRVAVASKIARATGAQPQFLTQDEVAQIAPLVDHGTIQEQRDLVAKLSRFGAVSTAVARQVAPNDDKFINLIGLATINERGIAARLVTDVLTGSEVLKGNPKLIDRNEATNLFKTFAGGAFALMPRTENGVRANAEAMLGADAARHGYSEWSTARGRYEAMVNQALGAYRDQKTGDRRGGLGVWQGQKIILPEDWSQQDFDQRLARADAAAIKRGSNGSPTWSNGKLLTVGDVKRLRLVAVGNGKYRLTDGSGFIGRKEGGFYELNMLRVGQPVGP